MNAPAILCCGEALIDMLAGTQRQSYIPTPGGSVFNTAITLGRLGVDVGLFSGLSADFFGDILRQTLQESRVDASLCTRALRPTTLSFVQLSEGQTRYTFFDENSAGRMLTPKDAPDIPPTVHTLFFGGISLASHPSAQCFESLMQRAATSHTIMLDPNIRTNFSDDEPAYRDRIMRMITLADIVKLSDEDADWLLRDIPPDQHAQHLLTMGPRLVLLTKGALGASGHTVNINVSVPASKVTVCDTVGAGDVFNGAVLDVLNRQGNLPKDRLTNLDKIDLLGALKFATKAAAFSVAQKGAVAPFQKDITI